MNALITVFTVVATVCAVGAILFTVADTVIAFREKKTKKLSDEPENLSEPLDENALRAVKELNEKLSELLGEKMNGNVSVSVETLSKSEAEKRELHGDTVIVING